MRVGDRQGERERERENPKQALGCQHRARPGGLDPTTMRSCPEQKSRVRGLTD